MDNDNKFLQRGCEFNSSESKKHRQVQYKHSCNKLDVFNWLAEINLPENIKEFPFAEIRFKNSRKEYFRIPDNLSVKEGDIVAVEANPGHDIGIITLKGEIVKLQMIKKNVNWKSEDIKKIYRKAKPYDIEKWCSAIELEETTMFQAREIAASLNLEMKISDVEYQGDKTKAIFFYTAESRVDFRELIKLLADRFLIRIEMKQIGVRQEASRLGGIGSCGRELCCSTWLTNFTSVSTNAARMQQLSLNPHKLAGQCSKLKCCLNYEYCFYEEALGNFPDMEIVLKTKKGDARHQKTDVFKKIMWYAYDSNPNNLIPIHVDQVKKIIKNNNKGIIPVELTPHTEDEAKIVDYQAIDNQDSLTRFDKKNKK